MYKAILLLLVLSVAVSCQEGTPLNEPDDNPVYLTEVHLGKGYLDHINNADRIVLSRVKETPDGDFVFENNTVELSRDDISYFKDILLDDRSYLFDVKKKCVFVPEYAMEFYVKDYKLLVLYAPLCKEFKIPYGIFKAQVIEIDPAFDQIEELLNKYKKQLEVNDENKTSFNG